MKTVGKVQVGQFQYLVVEDGDGEDVFAHDTDESNGPRIGLCKYFHQTIVIHKSMSKERKRATLAHELCHAFLQANAAIRDSWTHEDVCDVMEAYADTIMRAVNRLYPLGKADSKCESSSTE